jgi:hypothetical protein
MDMLNLWGENADAQYVLNTYVVVSYNNSYTTKFVRSMKNAFKRIHKET